MKLFLALLIPAGFFAAVLLVNAAAARLAQPALKRLRDRARLTATAANAASLNPRRKTRA